MKKSISLYIHIPFCKKKCNYCDFYSVEKKESLIDLYIKSLDNEIKNFISGKLYLLNTLYFGGGTPSVLTGEQIKDLFKIIKNRFDLSEVKEITFEVNPESFTEEKLEILYFCSEDIKKNVFRLSVGIQSFDEEILKISGRIHTKEKSYEVLNILKKHKINNFSIDLIFGFKEQNLYKVEEDLVETTNFLPSHISCYALTIEEGTLLFKNKYKIDFDLQSEMYNLIVENLAQKGYNRYEISNFSKPNFESKHNLNYWNYGEYLGFGCSAVTFNNYKRIKNVCTVEEYIKNNYKYETEILSEEQQVKERIMLGLRTANGIKVDGIFVSKYEEVIKKNLDKNYLVLDNGYLKVSEKYWFLSNQIISTFF